MLTIRNETPAEYQAVEELTRRAFYNVYSPGCVEHSFQRAVSLGYGAIVIFGSPANYTALGFQSCKRHRVCTGEGKFPAAMLVKELVPGALEGRAWTYRASPAMEISEEDAQRHDSTLAAMKKEFRPSQEEFYIMSHAFLE